MTTGVVTISTFTLNPTSNIDAGSTIFLRAWYSNSFVAGDGVSPVEGNPFAGQQGSYYNIECSLNADNLVVVPAFDVWATTLSNPTANLSAQLYVDDAPVLPMVFPNTAGSTGWQIPTVYGPVIAYDEIATYNRAKRLVFAPDTYFTADETIAEIKRIAGQFAYMAVGVNGIGSIDVPPNAANLPVVIGANNKRQPTLNDPVYWASQYTSFNAAVTAIGSAQATLIVSELMTGVTSATVPSTLTLQFQGAGGLSITTGQTLTIQGPISADAVKIFYNSLSGQGTVLFTGNNAISIIQAAWWGVLGDDTDQTTSLQAATNATLNYRTLMLPSGKIRLSASWSILNREGLIITGPGSVGEAAGDSTVRTATHLSWYGAAGSTMVSVDGTGYMLFQNIALHGRGLADVGIDNDQTVAATRINTANTYENVAIEADGTRATFVGFWNAHTSISNCEDITLNHVVVHASTNAAYNTAVGTAIKNGVYGTGAGTNAFNLSLNRVSFVAAAVGLDVAQGTVIVNNGTVGFNGVDYRFINTTSGGNTIQGVRSESSGQFVVGETGIIQLAGNTISSPQNAAVASISKAAASGSVSSSESAHWVVQGNTWDVSANQIIYDGGASSSLVSFGNTYPNRTGTKFNVALFALGTSFLGGDSGAGSVDPTFSFDYNYFTKRGLVVGSILSQTEGSALTISSNTITPTNQTHQVGAGLIKTITVPTNGFTSGTIALIPTAAFTYDATGNILGTGTAVVGRTMFATYSSSTSKWSMSY